MKLTIQEYQTIIDSRLVDLENSLQTYKDNEPIIDNQGNLNNLHWVVERAEALLKAYEAKVEAEDDEDAKELSEGCNLNMTAGLEEVLSIRKGE